MQIAINQLPKQTQQWFDMAQAGEPIHFVNSGQIIAKLALIDNSNTKKKPQRQAGRLAKKGRTLDPKFFEPLDDEELALW